MTWRATSARPYITVINQSSSAFSHILGDVSLVVYQIERLASFSAVTDRLGQMTEVLGAPASAMVAPVLPAGQENTKITRSASLSSPSAALYSGAKAETRRYCPPCHRHTFESSFLESSSIL